MIVRLTAGINEKAKKIRQFQQPTPELSAVYGQQEPYHPSGNVPKILSATNVRKLSWSSAVLHSKLSIISYRPPILLLAPALLDLLEIKIHTTRRTFLYIIGDAAQKPTFFTQLKLPS